MGVDGSRGRCGFAALLQACSLACSLAGAGAVEAQAPGQAALVWRTPQQSECAGASEIRERVARLTDRSLASEDSAATAFRIAAEVSPNSSSWRAEIALFDRAGRSLGMRDVETRIPDCRGLDVPVALVIATMLDELYASEARAAAARSGGLSRSRGFAIGASASAAFGGGPRPWLGTTLVVEWPRLGMVMPLTASAYLPVEDSDAMGRGSRSIAFHGGTGLCPYLGVAMLELRLCGNIEVGGIWATGVGLTKRRSGVLPMLLVGIEPKLLLAIGESVAIQVASAGYWVAVRPSFDFHIQGEGPRRLEGSPFVLMGRIGIISFLPW